MAIILQVINMLVAIIVLFAICWGPSLIDNVLIAFGVLNQLHYGYLKPMRMAFSLMSYANSCVNPVVYVFMSKNFRTSFQNTLSVLTRRKRRMNSAGTLFRQSSLVSRHPTCSYPLSAMENSSMLPRIIDLSDEQTGNCPGSASATAREAADDCRWEMSMSYT